MNYLDRLENESIYIIREAYNQIRDVALLWSIGKDSTTLLWLIRKAFFGQIPFPVIHLDTGYKFKEIYHYRDTIGKEWGLDVIVHKNEEAIQRGVCPEKGKLDCCTELKTNALKQIVKKKDLKALYLGIRRDEHGIRAKERYFSVRDEDFEWIIKDRHLSFGDNTRQKPPMRNTSEFTRCLDGQSLIYGNTYTENEFLSLICIWPERARGSAALVVKRAASLSSLRQIR